MQIIPDRTLVSKNTMTHLPSLSKRSYILQVYTQNIGLPSKIDEIKALVQKLESELSNVKVQLVHVEAKVKYKDKQLKNLKRKLKINMMQLKLLK